MITNIFASKVVKITLIACGILLVLIILTPYATMKSSTMGGANAWRIDEDGISVASFPTTGSGSVGEERMMIDAYTYALDSAAPSTEDIVGVDPRVIKTGSIEMTSENVSETMTDVRLRATSLGGFVQSSALSEDETGATTAYITVRIPAVSFESAMTDIKALGVHVDHESTSGEDVTAQYVDIEARLTAAQAQEAQYLIILEDAVTVGEVLAVQEHLGAVRSEIESLEGQLTYLADRTDLSTISVSISEEAGAGTVGDAKFDPRRDANSAFDFVITLGQQLISALIWVAVLGLTIGIPVGALWLIIRFFSNRRDNTRRK